jgi:hypothetical protein
MVSLATASNRGEPSPTPCGAACLEQVFLDWSLGHTAAIHAVSNMAPCAAGAQRIFFSLAPSLTPAVQPSEVRRHARHRTLQETSNKLATIMTW